MPASPEKLATPLTDRARNPWGTLLRPLWTLGVLAGAAVGLGLSARRAEAGQAGEICHLIGMHVHNRPEGHELRLHTDCAPVFHTLRLSDPARLVIDVAQGEVGAMAGTVPVGDGVLSQLVLLQVGAGERPVGRIEVGLASGRSSEVAREGQDIVVRTSAKASEAPAEPEGDPLAVGSRAFVPSAAWPIAPVLDAAAAEASAKPTPQGASPASTPAEASVQSFAPPVPRAAAAPSTDKTAAPNKPPRGDAAAAAAPTAGNAAVPSAPLPSEAAAPGTPVPTKPPAPALPGRRPTLRDMRADAGGTLLALSGAPAYHTVRLQGPPRLVVDVPSARAPRRRLRLHGQLPWLQRIRLGTLDPAAGGLRVVFDLRDETELEVAVHPDGLWVGPAKAASKPHAAAQLAGSKTRLAAAPAAPAAPAVPSSNEGPRAARLTGLRASHETVDGSRQTSIFLAGQGQLAAEVDAQNARAWILTVHNATLPARLEGPLAQASATGSAVSLVSAYQAQRDPAEVQLVVSLRGRATQTLTRVPGGLMWRIVEGAGAQDSAPAANLSLARVQASGAFPRTAAFRADAGAEQAKDGLRTHRISLDVKDADVVNVLRLISEETGENIISSDEVKGKISLKLRNVPAEQALDTVLRIKGLDRVRHNNILRIASAETIQKERDLEVARKKAVIEVEEVGIRMVTVNYANGKEVSTQLTPMLSARGSLQVDERTNTLIVQDVVSNLERLIELARRLDKQTPLVNIQARIVEATSNFARDMGVQWGGATHHSARTGNPTGVYFPGDLSASGAADLPTANQTAGAVTPARYAVNFPATLSGGGAGLGFVLGSAGGAQLLDLRLSAMESNGTGRIISSPEVSTLDNKTARVSQGIQIPVSTVSAAGTNTRFIPAVLQLEVTPHVTNDGTVLMRIHVEKSAPDFTKLGGQGDPTISTRQADTEVLVRDGDTSVIGGILTRETTDTRSEVPFLARIPLLGSLFRRHQSAENRAELLVFITPRIINREASTVQAGSVATSPTGRQTN